SGAPVHALLAARGAAEEMVVALRLPRQRLVVVLRVVVDTRDDPVRGPFDRLIPELDAGSRAVVLRAVVVLAPFLGRSGAPTATAAVVEQRPRVRPDQVAEGVLIDATLRQPGSALHVTGVHAHRELLGEQRLEVGAEREPLAPVPVDDAGVVVTGDGAVVANRVGSATHAQVVALRQAVLEDRAEPVLLLVFVDVDAEEVVDGVGVAGEV